MSLRIRELRLVGLGQPYGVAFTADGRVRPLSVIAGEISTGKTSVLEFIDYCLGASRHPRHLEIERRVQTALLEVEVADQVVVIERRVFTTEQIALVHRCSLSEIDAPHTTERRVLSPVGDPNSLSSFLLGATGLDGLRLREAPTQIESGTDPLSFRDVMPLCFLPNQRLDNKNLLLETPHMRALKLRQVIEIIFDVYDGQVVALSDRLTRLEEERRDLVAEITALDTFLRENDVPGPLDLDARRAALEEDLKAARLALDELSTRMRATTAYAADARALYARARKESGEDAARLRDRETLLRRLLPLRGQYAEDERKLVFFQEASNIFDPLRVQTCPACMQSLPAPAEAEAGGTCSLCHQHIVEAPERVDIGAERAAVRARLRSIERYIEDVEGQVADARSAYEQARLREQAAQERLDSDVARDLSPFMAQRDELVRTREALRAEHEQVAQQVRWRQGLARRSADAAQLEEKISDLRTQIETLRAGRPARNAVVGDLTDRFASLLSDFGFPKLNEPEPPYLSDTFTPNVRGNRYTDIGSTGALTLISLAWQMAIFERAVEQGQPHPGFLLIDSPQKNLMPEGQDTPTSDEFSDPAIPRRLWEHIVSWSGSMGRAAQLIIVDNRPPSVADDAVVVRYSARVDNPPYGLITDEIG